jgi:hypothetical protein
VVDESFVVSVERLRDDLADLKSDIRRRYRRGTDQVSSVIVRRTAAKVAEEWIAKIGQHPDVARVIDPEVVANTGVDFQRLLTFSEQSVTRKRYDVVLQRVLKDFTLNVIMPLKKLLNNTPVTSVAPHADATHDFAASAFVGHSFADEDREVVRKTIDLLEGMGINVETGAKPKADLISEKVKELIDRQYFFVGVFTRRDKIARKREWATSPWIIDEKAYAYARGKKLILLKEVGIQSIGGIQGDYEYIEFDREHFELALLKIVEVFSLSVEGFR